MKYILTMCCVLLGVHSSGQDTFQKINRDTVKLLIFDSHSATFYPTLLSRFNNFDSTLTLHEYQLLYYGFAFQPDYSAYADVKTKEIREAIDQNDYNKAIEIVDVVLKEIPVSLRANYQKAVALYLLDSTNLLHASYASRYSNLLNAILSTGDGLSCPTSFKVLFVDDEYEIMYKYYQVKRFTGQSLVYPCDRLNIEPNEFFKESAMYFDISESFIKMKELFKPEKSGKKKKKGN